MFESAILSSGPLKKRVWATCVSFSGQVLLVLFALAAPMIWPQAIPRVAWAVTLAPPTPPPPPPPPPPEQPMATHARVIPTQSQGRRLYEPGSVPKIARVIIDPPELPSTGSGPGVVGGQEGGSRDGIIGGILDQAARIRPTVKPPEPPPPQVLTAAAVAAPEKPKRILSQVELARPIRRVEPLYPPLARQARISGTVELIGVLGVDGRIHELKVISGHPLLINAAVDAVKQWVYAPTMLNGQPVEVQAPITVNFILNR